MLFSMCGIAEEVIPAETHEEPAPVVSETKEEPAEEPAEIIEETIEGPAAEPAEESIEEPAAEFTEEPAEEPEYVVQPLDDGDSDECTHPDRYLAAEGVVNFQEKATDNGDGTHTGLANIYNIDICPDCGRNLYVLKEENVQSTGPHNYYEGVCDICDAENRCSHENHSLIGPELDYKDITDNGNGTHTRTIREGNLYICNDCNETFDVWGDWGEPVTSSHVWREDGICNDCNAVNTCEHPNKTETEKYDVYSASRIDDTWHEEYGVSFTLVECPDCGLSIRTDGQEYCENRAHSYPNGVCVCGACVHVHRYADYKDTWGDYSNPIDNGDGTHTLTYQQMSSASCSDCGAEGLVGQSAVPFGKSEPMSEKHVFGDDGFCLAGCGAENTCEHTNTREESYYEYDYENPADLTIRTHSLNRFECSSTYCADCNKLLDQSREQAGVTVEPHSYDDDGICIICGMDSSCCSHENTVLTYRYKSLSGNHKTPINGTNTHMDTCVLLVDLRCTDCGRVLQSEEELGVYQVISACRLDSWNTCVDCGQYFYCEHPNQAVREDKTAEVVIERGESTHKIRYSIGKQKFCTDCGVDIDSRYDITTAEETDVHEYSSGVCLMCGAENACAHNNTETAQWADRIAIKYDNEFHTVLVQQVNVVFCEDCGETLRSEPVGEPKLVTTIHTLEKNGDLESCAYCQYFRQTVVCKKHTYVKRPGIAATCTESGLKAYYACSKCGAPKAEPVAIPAKGHTEKVVPEQPATCLIDGISEYTICSVCEELLTIPWFIDAPGYHETEIDPAVKPTCVTMGMTAGSHCSVCGEILEPQQELGYGDHLYENDECVYCSRVADIRNIEIESSDISLGVKDMYKLPVAVSPAKASYRLVYSSSNTKVAKVNGYGVITAVKPGTATIYVYGDGHRDAVTVTVKAGISRLSLSAKTLCLQTGDSHYRTLNAAVTGYTAGQLKWTSSNPSVVNVLAIGEFAMLIGLVPGTATVKVQAPNGKSASCKVTVVDSTKLTAVFVGCTYSMPLHTGTTAKFFASTIPVFEDPEAVQITWKSSSSKVVSIDSKTGAATVNAPGKATITVTAVQGRIKKTATMKVTVIDPAKLTGLKVSGISSKQTMYAGSEYTATLTALPGTSEIYENVVYSVSGFNPAILSCEQEGENVYLKAIAPGSTKVTFTATVGSVKKSFTSKVTIKDPKIPTSVYISGDSMPEMEPGVPLTLKYSANINAESCDESAYTITWKSSNTKIATVDNQGNVTMLKPGTVTLTVTVKYGKITKKATKKIRILNRNALYSVIATTGYMEGKVGGTMYVDGAILPNGIDYETLNLTCSSSNKKLATVDQYGFVELKAPGTVTITVTVTQGKIKKTTKIKIKIVK